MLVVIVCGGISQFLYDAIGWILGLLSYFVTIIILMLVIAEGKMPDPD
jgi:hypothetical protein